MTDPNVLSGPSKPRTPVYDFPDPVPGLKAPDYTKPDLFFGLKGNSPVEKMPNIGEILDGIKNNTVDVLGIRARLQTLIEMLVDPAPPPAPAVGETRPSSISFFPAAKEHLDTQKAIIKDIDQLSLQLMTLFTPKG